MSESTFEVTSESSIKNFFSNNMGIIILIGVIIFILIIYVYFVYGTRDTSMTDTTKPISCEPLDKKIQMQIANDIRQKIKEIDACDCKSDSESNSRSRSNSRSQRTEEKF